MDIFLCQRIRIFFALQMSSKFYICDVDINVKKNISLSKIDVLTSDFSRIP